MSFFLFVLSFENDFAKRKKERKRNAFNSSQFERIAKPLCKQMKLDMCDSPRFKGMAGIHA